MKRLIPLLVTCLLSPLAAVAQDNHSAVQGDVLPVEFETVQSDVRNIVDAAFEGDIDVMLDYTHPAIINAMGGRIAARQTLSGVIEQVRTLNMSLLSFSFPDDPIFVLGEEFRYVIVPTMSQISVNEGQVESVNFQFGIQSQRTGAWVYFEGSQLSDEILASLFPDFPTDFEFPETYQKKL
ncbi:MAG: hypothetical protein V3T51_01125 [Gammaproteobacteria bacterium]